jgi:hypothetical protein
LKQDKFVIVNWKQKNNTKQKKNKQTEKINKHTGADGGVTTIDKFVMVNLKHGSSCPK